MARQVIWTKLIVEEFIHLAKLTEDEEMIMRTRADGWSITKQATTFNMSVSTVNRIIKRLKKKYDAVQKEHPNEFPIRRTSKKEEWMDSH